MKNIKIFKCEAKDCIIFYFLANNYPIAIMLEYNNKITFREFYYYYLNKRNNTYINSVINILEEIELYEFIFSGDADRLFLNRTKPITYLVKMKYALKVEKELKECFEK